MVTEYPRIDVKADPEGWARRMRSIEQDHRDGWHAGAPVVIDLDSDFEPGDPWCPQCSLPSPNADLPDIGTAGEYARLRAFLTERNAVERILAAKAREVMADW